MPGSAPLSDVEWIHEPPHAERRGALREAAARLDPPLRILAEDVLGEHTRIDWIATDPAGAIVAVLIGEPGADLALVARGLAQAAWVRARVRDWVQLAPAAGLHPDAPVRALLLAEEFGVEAVAAAEAAGPDVLLARFRCLGGNGRIRALVEPLGAQPPSPGHPTAPPAHVRGAPFRSGLTDADLDLRPEEIREFE
jgi:hypothetical protein